MRKIRYLLWSFVYLTHTAILIIGMRGFLGKEAKDAFEELAAKLKIGKIGLISLSVVCGTIFYLVCGSAILYISLKMYGWF